MPKVIVWKKGPPPSKGWWPASICMDNSVYRWWNGGFWSVPVRKDTSAVTAGKLATLMSTEQRNVRWRERPSTWPERSMT